VALTNHSVLAAEDNPANDYPEEELSSADEYDDPTAIYSRYRRHASDDEEFDVEEFDSEGETYGPGRFRSRFHRGFDSDEDDGDDDDDESYGYQRRRW